ncbi:MAG: thiol:disulfide interchange protein DsbA/DsbL [Aeromonas sp.]
MKKVLMFLAAMLLNPVAFAAPEFKEGVHYDVVKQTTTAKPEVMEFFSYLCPACGAFEPLVDSLKSELPAGTEFKKNPVAFLGREMGPELQRAYAMGKLLGAEQKINPAIFGTVKARKYPQSRDDLKTIFAQNGIEGKTFDASVESFAVSGMVARFDRNSATYNIRGVPAFLVNGKFLIKNDSIKSGEMFNQLVQHLLGLK